MQYRDKLYRGNKGIHNTKAEKIQNKAPNSREKAAFAGVAARVPHSPTPGAPISCSDAEDPRRREAQP